MSTVKLAAKLAEDKQDRNGLEAIAEDVCANRRNGRWIAIVQLECVRVSDEVKKGDLLIPTVGVVHIEPMLGEHGTQAAAMMAAAYEHRTGRTPLPLDDAEAHDEERVAAEHRDPVYGGPLKGGKDAELLDDKTDGWDEGPVTERVQDVWLDGDNAQGGGQ